MLNKPSSKIAVWAIDPFENVALPNPFEVKSLRDWALGTGFLLKPVYILNLPTPHTLALEEIQLTVKKMAHVERVMTEFLKGINCSDILSPKILITHQATEKILVERLIHFSEEVNAQMMVVSSQGQKGFDRLRFGSFSENLLYLSPIPLFFLNHGGAPKIGNKGNRVLFPTDFSRHSEETFTTLIETVKCFECEVVIYSAVSLPNSVIAGDGTILIPENYTPLDEDETDKEKAEKWIQKAQEIGVKCSFRVENLAFGSNIGQAIIEAAKANGAQIIAMASNSGRTGSLLFGSVASEVYRSHIFPVWVCGPNSKPMHEMKEKSESKTS